MSETHDTRAQGTPGRAIATLSQIRLMWGSIEVDGDVVTRTGMYGHKEVWKRVQGTGASAVYQLTGEH